MAARPLVFAHRGASSAVAEHTLAAYQLAIDQGADGLECDVRLTADGHLVCVHDRRIDRTSDGWGVVSTKTLADLQRHDFGSWVDTGPQRQRRPLRERRRPGGAARRSRKWLGPSSIDSTSEVPPVVDPVVGAPVDDPSDDLPAGPGNGILTLPTLLDLVTSSPRPIRLLIETKHPTRYAGWVEEAVVDQLRRFGLAAPDREGPHPVSLMSFSELAIRRFRALAPGMPRVFLMDRVPLRMRTGELPFGARIAGPDVAILHAHPGYAARVHLAGGELFVWTVDDAEDVRLCRSLGVSAVITNRPADVLAALETPRPVHAAPTTGGDALGEATPHTV